MARPKANTKAGQEASRKWRETMLKKYGGEDGLRNFMAERGAKGGANGHTGGFASNKQLAIKAGRKGGKISRKKQDNSILWEHIKEKAQAMCDSGVSMREIARTYNMNYSSLIYYLKKKGNKDV